MTREGFISLVDREFGISPDAPWADDPESVVFRHPIGRKWFALLMRVKRERFMPGGEGVADVINLKCDPFLREAIVGRRGIFTAYHMNKTHWITVALDMIPDEEIAPLVHLSFDLTRPKRAVRDRGD